MSLNATHLPSGSRVMFRGVLSILALAHLSQTGIQYLDRDFKERVMGSILNGISAAKKYSNLKVKSIFELKAEPNTKQYEVKVLIQGFMGSAASYMRCKSSTSIHLHLMLMHLQLILLPMDYCSIRQTQQRLGNVCSHTWLFVTEVRHSFRNFEIVSIDVETYKLSRTFLFRHHTLRVMRDILSNYKSGVPTHKRTPQWFIDQYFRGFAYPPHRCWSRINSIEDAESSDEGPDDLVRISRSRPANAQTHRPRHLRIVHQNEVWSIFASHSEWIYSLVQNHKDLKGDIHGYSWESFLSKIPQLRKKAMSDEGTNGRWGLRDEQDGFQTKLVADIPASIPKPISQPSASKKRKHQTRSPPACVSGFLCDAVL